MFLRYWEQRVITEMVLGVRRGVQGARSKQWKEEEVKEEEREEDRDKEREEERKEEREKKREDER